ncbi:hypothetical protein [Thermaerobacter litoralis]
MGRWDELLSLLRSSIPAVGVVAYGSNAWNGSGQDYDLLAVVEDPELLKQRKTVEAYLRGQTGLPVDLNIATVGGLRYRALLDPYVWHAVTTGRHIGYVPRPPRVISKRGAELALLRIEMLLEEADALELEGIERTEWLVPVAKSVAALEQAMAGRADLKAYSRRVHELADEAALRQAVASLKKYCRRIATERAIKYIDKAYADPSKVGLPANKDTTIRMAIDSIARALRELQER